MNRSPNYGRSQAGDQQRDRTSARVSHADEPTSIQPAGQSSASAVRPVVRISEAMILALSAAFRRRFSRKPHLLTQAATRLAVAANVSSWVSRAPPSVTNTSSKRPMITSPRHLPLPQQPSRCRLRDNLTLRVSRFGEHDISGWAEAYCIHRNHDHR